MSQRRCAWMVVAAFLWVACAGKDREQDGADAGDDTDGSDRERDAAQEDSLDGEVETDGGAQLSTDAEAALDASAGARLRRGCCPHGCGHERCRPRDQDGLAFCWGGNTYMQLGIGGKSAGPALCGSGGCAYAPVQVFDPLACEPISGATGCL